VTQHEHALRLFLSGDRRWLSTSTPHFFSLSLQQGDGKAEYGVRLLEHLLEDLQHKLGKGFSIRSLRNVQVESAFCGQPL